MVTGAKLLACLVATIFATESLLALRRRQLTHGGTTCVFAAATAPRDYRNKCFVATRRAVSGLFKANMGRVTPCYAEKAPKAGADVDVGEDVLADIGHYAAEAAEQGPPDPTAGDRSLDGWKQDMADIPGPWRIYYPLAVDDAEGISPNTNIRPSMLFCDITGAVTGPEHKDSGKGSFILDAKESVDIDDGETFVHNRKLAIIMLSAKTFSNIRVVLAGRVFYSKEPVINEMNGIIQMRAAMFIGQAFVESYRSEEMAETLQRIQRRITVLDREGNEVNPLLWEYMPLNEPGSPFRWMHGTDKWKLLGPFTAYRALGSKINVPHKTIIFDKYDDVDIYNLVDPLKLNKQKFTKPENVEEETRRVIDAVFEPDAGVKKICVKDNAYLDAFHKEMVQLAKAGPDFYRGTME